MSALNAFGLGLDTIIGSATYSLQENLFQESSTTTAPASSAWRQGERNEETIFIVYYLMSCMCSL